jgi:hypothetical protein
MRNYQALLDSGLSKLVAAGLVEDHRARWDLKTLTPLEKVTIILNDLNCEAFKGEYNSWLRCGNPARGKYELQRVITAMVDRYYDLDPTAAEIVLGVLSSADQTPVDSLSQDQDPCGFLTTCYSLYRGRVSKFLSQVIDLWDEDLDPFTLPAAAPKPRARLSAPVLAPSQTPVHFPSVMVGLTPEGSSLDIRAVNDSPAAIIHAVALGLWMANAEAYIVNHFVRECSIQPYVMEKVLQACVDWVSVDGKNRTAGSQ